MSSLMRVRPTSLNPSFNGIWSRTIMTIFENMNDLVLILLLMEYGLGQIAVGRRSRKAVLILLLMEYGLGLAMYALVGKDADGHES